MTGTAADLKRPPATIILKVYFSRHCIGLYNVEQLRRSRFIAKPDAEVVACRENNFLISSFYDVPLGRKLPCGKF